MTVVCADPVGPTCDSDEWLVFEVTDTGCGISQHALSSLFTEYVQVLLLLKMHSDGQQLANQGAGEKQGRGTGGRHNSEGWTSWLVPVKEHAAAVNIVKCIPVVHLTCQWFCTPG